MRKIGICIFVFLSINTGTKCWAFDSEASLDKDLIQQLESRISDYHANRENNPEKYFRLLRELSIAYSDDGLYLRARDSLKKAIIIKSEWSGRTDSTYSIVLSDYASVLTNIGYYTDARDLLLECLRLNKNIYGEVSVEVVHTLHSLSQLFDQLGLYSNSLEFNQIAYHITENLAQKDDELTAVSISRVANSYYRSGDFQLALTNILKSLNIFRKVYGHEQSVQYVEALELEGMIYDTMGQLDKAEAILLEALDLKYTIPDISPNLIIETLNDLGVMYRHLHNYPKSLEYFETARNLAVRELGKSHHDYATIINNLANILQLNGDYEKALTLYNESANIYRMNYGEFNVNYATALNNVASLYRQMKQYDKAKELYLKVIEIDRQVFGEKHPDYATVVNNLGILYSSMGQPKTAEPLYLKALELREKYLGVNHPSYGSSLENLGLYYFSHESYTKAEEYFRKALNIRIDQIESVFPTLTERERIQFYHATREDVERFYTIALKLHEQGPELASYLYNVQLSTKAIIYYASDKMRNAIYNSDNEDLIKEYTQWRLMNNQLARYYQLGKSTTSEMNVDLPKLEQDIDNLEKNLALKSNSFNNEISLYSNVKWTDVKKTLQPGEAAIEIIRLRGFVDTSDLEDEFSYGFSNEINYIALILRYNSDAPEMIVLGNGNALENEYYNLFKNSVQLNLKTDHNYKYYWEKIEEKLKGINTIYFSPDGIYNKINPNIIYDSKDQNYLIDKYDIHTVTNSRDLFDLKSRRSSGVASKAELFGNPNFKTISTEYDDNQITFSTLSPLPGTEKEINYLQQKLESINWDVTTHLQMDASEQALKAVKNPKILHIATHGFFLPEKSILGDDNPLFKSGLILSNDRNYPRRDAVYADDGILTAYEAMNLNLDETEIVILSACETGLGEVKNGEGIYGLERSFRVAGAKALIISLFKVDDEATSKLMSIFYDHYLESGQIFSSFKKAQIELRLTYPAPLVWGAFLIVGS